MTVLPIQPYRQYGGLKFSKAAFLPLNAPGYTAYLIALRGDEKVGEKGTFDRQ
jgi:hypothetical protein